MAVAATSQTYGPTHHLLTDAADPFAESREKVKCGAGEVPCMTQIQPGMSITTIEVPITSLEPKIWHNFINQLQLASGVVVLRSVGQPVWNKDNYVTIQDYLCEAAEIVEARPMFIISVVKGDCRSFLMTMPGMASISLADPDSTFGLPDLRVGGMPSVMGVVMKRRVAEPVIRKLIMTGEPIDAHEAQRIGLVDFVGDVEAECARLIFRNCQPKTVYYMWQPDVEKQREDVKALK